MGSDTLQVGNVQIVTITDVECTLPFTLPQLYAGVELERWTPYRERYAAPRAGTSISAAR